MSDVAPVTDGRRAPGAPTGLEFTVLGAEPIEYAATPGVRFHLHVTEPEGREIYTIALSSQIQIDPARRSYDDATRARLVELFGPPERWGATTHSFQWARIDVARAHVQRVDGVHGRGPVHLRPRGGVGAVLRLAARRRASRSRSTSTARCSTAARHDRLQVVLVPWSCSARWSMPVVVWRRTIEAPLPGRRLDPAARRTRSTRCGAQGRAAGSTTFDETVRGLLGAG